MDYTGIVIAIAIVVYGILTYRRREQRFRDVMGNLSRGMKPPEQTANTQGRYLVTAGAVGLVVLALAAAFTGYGVQHGKLNPLILAIAFIFFLLFMLLARTFLRDIVKYREVRKSRDEVKP
jgi:hypothetical protein